MLNIPVFCAIWLKKCDFLTEKLGIRSDPDPKLFIPDPDPDPSKSSGSTTLYKGLSLDGGRSDFSKKNLHDTSFHKDLSHVPTFGRIHRAVQYLSSLEGMKEGRIWAL